MICSKRPHLCTSICCHYAPFSDNSCQTIVYCKFTMLCTHRLSTFSLRLSNSFSRHRPRCSQPPPVRTHWSPGDRQSWPKNGIFVAPTPKCDAQNRIASQQRNYDQQATSAVRMRATCAVFTLLRHVQAYRVRRLVQASRPINSTYIGKQPLATMWPFLLINTVMCCPCSAQQRRALLMSKPCG